MKNKKKTLLLVLCAVAVVAASVLGTLAYLTDRSTVENTFTVGNVSITLDEAVTDENGKLIDESGNGKAGGRTELGNQYHLLPGKEYIKDPMITVNAGSEDSYVRMILTVYNADAVQALIDADNGDGDAVKDYADLFYGWDAQSWLYEGFVTGEEDGVSTISFEFRYVEPVAGAQPDGTALAPLFEGIKVPGYATNEEMAALYDGGFKIVVEGHAIQSSTFADADEAWAAFDKQYNG